MHASEPCVAAAMRAGALLPAYLRQLNRPGAMSPEEPLTQLTPRQREVLQLLAEGHSTRALAERLSLSVKTVETHRAEIGRRLGISDIAGLTRYAVRIGLVSSNR